MFAQRTRIPRWCAVFDQIEPAQTVTGAAPPATLPCFWCAIYVMTCGTEEPPAADRAEWGCVRGHAAGRLLCVRRCGTTLRSHVSLGEGALLRRVQLNILNVKLRPRPLRLGDEARQRRRWQNPHTGRRRWLVAGWEEGGG